MLCKRSTPKDLGGFSASAFTSRYGFCGIGGPSALTETPCTLHLPSQ
jgi:hypothetical protein